MSCLECNCETDNPKFCSRSCSTTYNNRKSPKRQRQGSCKECGIVIKSTRTYCGGCTPHDVGSRTKKEVYSQAKYQKSAVIRQHARRVYDGPNECLLCGYNFHVDICHVRDISDFPETALVAEINSADNLIALCKNHHWEFDNGGPASRSIG